MKLASELWTLFEVSKTDHWPLLVLAKVRNRDRADAPIIGDVQPERQFGEPAMVPLETHLPPLVGAKRLVKRPQGNCRRSRRIARLARETRLLCEERNTGESAPQESGPGQPVGLMG